MAPFILNQQKLAQPNIFEVPTPLSKLLIKALMVSKWGRQTHLDGVFLQQPRLGHHLVSPSLFQLLMPAIKEQLCSTESDVYTL